MGDDITIGVTEIVNNIEVTAQPNDQIVDISVVDNTDVVTLNVTPTIIEINVNKGSSYAKWGTITGILTDQVDLVSTLALKADLVAGKVPSSQLPSYVDDVIEVANYASLPITGESGKIYITIDNNHIFRWTGSTYVEITDNTAVWGAITGTLSSQTDLQNALNAKFNNPTGDTAQYIAGDGSLITFPVAGQSGTLVRQIRNTTGSTLTKGTIVYINGANGNKPTIAKAIATGDSTSAQTFGMLQADLANNSNGYVVCIGDIIGLDTSAITEGTQLYLSSTTAGAYTTTKQVAPAHLVYIGVVTRSHPTLGQIEVKIQNGYELDEIHDVLITSKTNNDILTYESSTSLWKNKSISTILGYTPSNDSLVVHLAGTETITGAKTFENLVKITGNGLSSGYAMEFDCATVDAIAVKQSGVQKLVVRTNGEILAQKYIIDGGFSTQFLKANGTLDSTVYQVALTNPITGTGTTNYIPKFTGTSALGSSLIYDNGTNVFVGGSGSNSNRFTVVDNGTTLVGQQILMQNASSANDALNIVHSGTGKLIKGTKGIEVFNISNTGGAYFADKVGIGTTSPLSLFNVQGSGYFPSKLIILSGAEPTRYNANIGLNIVGGSTLAMSFGTRSNNVDYDNTLNIINGNVGIGTTSPDAPLGFANALGDKIKFNSGSGNSYKIGLVAAVQGGDALLKLSAGESISAGEFGFYSGSSYKMFINNSGNVGIGTTSPSGGIGTTSTGTLLDIYDGTAIGNNGGALVLSALGNSSRKLNLGQIRTILTDGTPSAEKGDMAFSTMTGSTLSERMRITSGGDVLINSTSNTLGGKLASTLNDNGYAISALKQGTYGAAILARVDNINSDFCRFFYSSSNTQLGSISTNGTNVFFNSVSDYRLKDDFKNYSGLDLISKIKTYDYKWKSDNSRMFGVKAHELQEVIPYAVTGEKDGEQMQSVDYSKLVPILVQAIQELNEKINILENK